MNAYVKGKESVREKALDWQNSWNDHSYSWSELSWWSEYFEKLGRRYGLLREFRENGIC